LFCVPGIGGEPLGLSHLAARIGRERPVYGFRATILRESPGAALRIEDIAREYLDDLERLAPDGPVHLCGHSFGAIVALEMVHQLRARGRRPRTFAVIDTPLGAGRPGLVGTVRDTIRNLPAWLWYDALQSDPLVLAARVAGKSAETWQRLRVRAAGRSPGHWYPDLRAYFGARQVPQDVAGRMRARFDAVHRYERRPVPDHVVLFRSRAQALMGRSDRCLGWDELAASVEVFDVPGHHESCTKPPHVETLATRLAEHLRRADAS
jgi:thioesterase domain-containing protein